MKIVRFLISPVLWELFLLCLQLLWPWQLFIENDHGLQASYNLVYNTRWFEFILLLPVINLIGQMITFRLYRKEKRTVLLFHLSFVMMITGRVLQDISAGKD